MSLPPWRGEATQAANHLLVFGQGWSDKLQFARFLNAATDRFAQGSMVAEPNLLKLLRRSFPACEFLQAPSTDEKCW